MEAETTGHSITETELIQKLEMYLKLGGKDAKIFKSIYRLEKPYRLSTQSCVKAFASLLELEIYVYFMVENDA